MRNVVSGRAVRGESRGHWCGIRARAADGDQEMSEHRTGRIAHRPRMPKGDVVRAPGGKLRSHATAEAKKAFLEALAATGSIVAGAVAADRSKRTVYLWRERSAAFAQQWDDALAVALASLETEAYRRAVTGCEEPVMRGGKVVTTVRRYSDRLLTLLLRAHAPERYATPQAAVVLGVQAEEKRPVRVTFRIHNGESGEPGMSGGPPWRPPEITGKAESER